ncbi:50S ribosomal protein L29 [Spiroplasma endosymbiont of Polydrusus pterygomalis]|uniref:50S ribosomal protein L29 n=1 Tax=Spiroplasma endosymbiont of Polydrusus pterygomalis TaxID=3139327 RepID=UPI003CCA81DE
MNDLNKKSVEELKKLEEESRAELFALRFQSAMGNLEKPHRIGELKKQIAWILTILSTRKNAGENTEINIKINLSETYAKIEKESQAFAKQHKEKNEQMMAEQQAADGQMPNLMDLPLTDAMDLTASAAVDESSPKREQPAPVVDKKPAVFLTAAEKKAIVEKKPVTAKAEPSVPKKVLELKKYADKAEIEVLHDEKKAESTKTVKKATELNAKEKLAAIKSSVVGMDTAKGRGSNVKIDLDLKTKDPNVKEYTYGENRKENRDKILTAGKTTKKAVDKTAKKGIGKK